MTTFIKEYHNIEILDENFCAIQSEYISDELMFKKLVEEYKWQLNEKPVYFSESEIEILSEGIGSWIKNFITPPQAFKSSPQFNNLSNNIKELVKLYDLDDRHIQNLDSISMKIIRTHRNFADAQRYYNKTMTLIFAPTLILPAIFWLCEFTLRILRLMDDRKEYDLAEKTAVEVIKDLTDIKNNTKNVKTKEKIDKKIQELQSFMGKSNEIKMAKYIN